MAENNTVHDSEKELELDELEAVNGGINILQGEHARKLLIMNEVKRRMMSGLDSETILREMQELLLTTYGLSGADYDEAMQRVVAMLPKR